MPKKIVTRKSAIHGNGMFAVAPIRKGERLIEYKGRRRTHEDVDAGDSGDVDSGHTFLFTLNDQWVIDANFEGNDARFPVRHIYCVGRNYAEHAREMGHDPDREPPFFFMKPADAIVTDGTDFAYPSHSKDVHHEL